MKKLAPIVFLLLYVGCAASPRCSYGKECMKVAKLLTCTRDSRCQAITEKGARIVVGGPVMVGDTVSVNTEWQVGRINQLLCPLDGVSQ